MKKAYAGLSALLVLGLILGGHQLPFALPALAENPVPGGDHMIPFSWNEDRGPLAGGKIQYDFHSDYANYLDESGTWQKTDYSFVQTATGFLLETAPYKVFLPLTSAGSIEFSDRHKYDVAEKRIRNDDPVHELRTFTGISDVPGVLVPGEGILYAGAFPDIDADLFVRVYSEGVQYLVKWNSKPTVCSNPAANMNIGFVQTHTNGVTPKDLNRAAIGSTLRIINGLSVERNSFRKIITPEAYIWDTITPNVEPKKQSVTLRASLAGGTLTGQKTVPCSFFTADVNYPVFTDDTSTFYPHSSDGYAEIDAADTWANNRAGNGTATSSASIIQSIATNGSNWQRIFRGKISFETSSLPDSINIASATVTLTPSAFDDSFSLASNANSKTYLCAGGGADTTLAASDYQNTGSTSWGVSDNVQSSLSVDVADVITMNATGIAAVDPTGYTVIGIRQGFDINNSEPGHAANKWNGTRYYTSEQTGTDKDPLLTIVSSGGPAPATIMPIIILGGILNRISTRALAYDSIIHN